MTHPEVLRLHDRIDELDRKWDKKWGVLSDSVNEANATMIREATQAGQVRKVVLGNGGQSIDRRLTKLETIRAFSSKWYTIIVVTCASLITGLIVAGVSHACK